MLIYEANCKNLKKEEILAMPFQLDFTSMLVILVPFSGIYFASICGFLT